MVTLVAETGLNAPFLFIHRLLKNTVHIYYKGYNKHT